MNLKSRSKVQVNFNMASMTDIIFLLLIFFMLTSTLVSPNVLKLFLPKSSSKTFAKQTISVSITEDLKYFIDLDEVSFNELEYLLKNKTANETDPTIVLNVDKSVDMEYVVDVMDIANRMQLKMVLATKQR
ncbi:MAG: biopolymer transport protein ExbD [Sphingobacteriales bacterium]|jgi:biopolymer transport protein ExbD